MFVFQICDLGSARNLEHTVQQTTIIGTYAWMAPEVRNNIYTSPELSTAAFHNVGRAISTSVYLSATRLHQERMSRRRWQRSVELSMWALAEVVVLHTSQNFTLYGKRPLCRSVEKKLAFVRYRKGQRPSITIRHEGLLY